MTPKLFQRIQRFHKTLALVTETARPQWAQLALDAGYFDQSHLIRDFLSSSGAIPEDYLRQQNRLRQRNVRRSVLFARADNQVQRRDGRWLRPNASGDSGQSANNSGGDRTMSAVSVRYFVNDVESAIHFYTDRAWVQPRDALDRDSP